MLAAVTEGFSLLFSGGGVLAESGHVVVVVVDEVVVDEVVVDVPLLPVVEPV
jgi:hypothetical protein